MKVGSAKWFAAQTFSRARRTTTVVTSRGESTEFIEIPKPSPTNNELGESPTTAVCALRGDRIPPQEAQRIGLGTVRSYYPCAAGRTLNSANVAGVVCSCAGCGPKCPKFQPGGERDES